MAPETRRRILSVGGTLLGLGLLAVAAWIFKSTLARYEFSEAVMRFREIPSARLLLAFACASLSYFIQSLYDWLSLSCIGKPGALRRAVLAGFVSNAMVNNMGFSLLTAASLRFRFYSGWGYRPLEIAQVVALTKASFFLGLLTLAGLTQVVAPVALPGRAGELLSPRLLGLVLLAVPVLILVWSRFAQGGHIQLGKVRLVQPDLRIVTLMIAVSSLHLVFSGLTLYFLLPSGPLREAGLASPLAFLGVFMALKFVVFFFPIPGGLGVFEGTAMALLTPALPDYPVLGALLAYRLVYYVVPFAAALLLLAGYESVVRSGFRASLRARKRRHFPVPPLPGKV
jgi:uncharacterized membrane protein YbhN (UPF0104 family)